MDRETGYFTDIRTQRCCEAPENPHGDYVLYWMTAYRRTRWNFSLQRAVEWSRRLDKPILILEALRCGYPWASDRFHRFVMEGMRDNAARLHGTGVLYYPYLEPNENAGKGLLRELSARACVVVTDDFPAFFLPGMIRSAASQVGVLIEKVDSAGLLPIRLADMPFATALSFRRFLQKNIEPFLHSFPEADPLAEGIRPFQGKLPSEILRKWPPASTATIASPDPATLAAFPIDHSVAPSPVRGGELAANRNLSSFMDHGLSRYSDYKNQLDCDATSGLSPYLHFGHISVHQVFHELIRHQKWSPSRISTKSRGQREGWWGMIQDAESFLDVLITWRELGWNTCVSRPDHGRYESLPDWALRTLGNHRHDRRPYLYTSDQLENAQTNDDLWNAAQRQLTREGRIPNYLRMLWGKKILEWTRSPEEALDTMIHLNNKYALDGRDPNSYSGIFWILGRYDRPWAPERPVYGRIRYMSSKNTRRKVQVKPYLQSYAE